MEGAISAVFEAVLKRTGSENKEVKNKLLEEIKSVKTRYDTVSSHFETQDDPDLIEASIYEMKSLSARYSYLLREARKQGLTRDRSNILEHSVHG